MSVRVVSTSGEITTFDSADGWGILPTGHIDVVKKGTDPNPDKAVGSFAQGQWQSVKLISKEDRAALLTEAVELIGDVDDGNFGHQSVEWQNRAEAFLANVSQPN